MKKKKSIRLLFVLTIVLSMAVSLSVVTTYAADNNYSGVVVASGSCGTNVNYEVYRVDADNYTLVISGNGDMEDYTSSSTKPWDGYTITEIFVEDGVDTIGAYSFSNKYSIKNVHLSDAISSINQYAFYYSLGIESINIPENLMTLGAHAFELCGSSSGAFGGSLVIPEGITNIPDGAFSQAGGIESIQLPSTLKKIGMGAFTSTGVKSIVLPEGFTSIGTGAFASCSLESVKTPSTLKEISERAFNGNKSLESVSLAEGLQKIGKEAFRESHLKTIDIPGSITYIGDKAFAYTDSLTSVYFMGDAPSFYSSSGTHINFVTAFDGDSVTAYYLADNITWNSSNMTNKVTWKPWYNLETCDISYDEIVEYTGSYVKPEVVISSAGQELEFGTQYTLRYVNNKELGTADIEITGMGECRGQVTKHFDIKKKIENCNITSDPEAYFTGNEVTISYSVSDGDKVLTEGEDFTVTYKNNVAIGTATAVFEGKGYYMDTAEKTFEIVEKNHVWDEGKITKESTCTEDGVRTFTCKGCGETRTEVITSEGHKYSTEYTIDKQPTCTENGSKSYHCTVCGEQKPDSAVDVDALGHSYGDWAIKQDATCTSAGSKEKVCSVCGDQVVEEIPAKGHSFASEFTVDKEPTCTEDGSKSKHCANCEEVAETTSIPATGHAYGAWTVVTASTCENSGLEQHVCETCGHTESRDLDPNGHAWNSSPTVDKEPTCTSDGSRSIHCKNCDAVMDSEVIPAKGHSYSDWETTKEATCTKVGSKERVCATCGHKEIEEIPAKGHSWNSEPTVDKTPTCTAAGSQSVHCARCDATKDEDVIPAKGHSWNSEPTVDKAPTCTTAGSQSVHCARCDAVKEGSETSIPAKGHSFSAWTTTKTATEIAAGQQSRKCSVCGKSESKAIAQLKPTLPAVKISTPKAAKKAATVKWKKVSKANQKKIAKIQIQYSMDKTFKTGVKTVTAKKTAASKKISKLKSKKTYYVRIRAYKKSGGAVHVSKWSAVKKVKAK